MSDGATRHGCSRCGTPWHLLPELGSPNYDEILRLLEAHEADRNSLTASDREKLDARSKQYWDAEMERMIDEAAQAIADEIDAEILTELKKVLQ